MGHFIAAKIFKTRVEKFFLFFNPWFSLFKFKKGETEYGMGWLPLGGYVKIAGMIDESMDKEQMKQPPQPYEFRSKPAWQRLIIMLGGVSVNIILAFIIYMCILFAWGEQYLPTKELKYGITVDSLGYEIGLRNGDKILSLDNQQVEDFFKIPARLVLDEVKTIQVERNREKTEVVLPKGFLGKLVKHKSPDFISIRFPFEVSRFTKVSAGQAAGLQKGDKIIGIDSLQLQYFDEFKETLKKFKNTKTTLTVVRKTDTLKLPVQIPAEAVLGVYPVQDLSHYFSLKEKKYSVLEAIPAGFTRGVHAIDNYLKNLKLLFSPEVKAYESVGGFITIGNIFPGTWDWEAFWSLTAFLSVMLAILNVLPIPALDGGHVLFLFYEIITRRKPSDKFLEYAQIVGMVLLFGLLILANGNDIAGLFK